MATRNIVSRNTWGAAQPANASNIFKTTWHKNIEVWIHHTEYPTLAKTANVSQERARMREIQRLHLIDRKWDDIGYNYVIMPSGRVYEGRGKGVRGSHATGENDKPGIAFDGNFSSQIPTEEALQTLSWLLDELKLNKTNFKGHREYSGGSTDCPGDALFNYIKKKSLPSWKEGEEPKDSPTSDGGGFTFPRGLAANEVFRQVPTPVDEAFAVDEFKNPQEYYNTVDIKLDKAKDSKYAAANAYLSGGFYDLKNRCSFTYKYKDETRSIHLIVPPSGISWTYSLRTKIEDTYGGQVIQILGVQIDNFKLSGYVPTGFWGKNNNYLKGSGDLYQYYQDENSADQNGLVHVANFFRDFFSLKSQNSYITNNMVFSYPHYGWSGTSSIKIIPYDFPRVRISNDEILPQWELECSIVEFLSSHFVSQATTAAKKQLNYLPEGIGFTKFIEWSDPTATSDVSISEEARSLGASYANFVREFDPKESDALSQAGFSYPPEVIDRTITSKVQEVIQDRFGINV